MDFNWPIIGHDRLKKFLQTSLVNGKMNHAYLFYGPEKVGKTATAKLFAKSVLCENSKGNGPVPCDECST
ncbi:MAG: hypothetical protein V1763_03340, partial [Parcubacteria group bacterium]